MASPLQSNPSKRRFQPFRRRRQTTTTTTQAPEVESSAQESGRRETLLYACPEPEGCPTPVLGQKYEPVKIGGTDQPRDVLDTIYRQEVVKNKKVMRIRKKQRKPGDSKPSQELKPMSLKAVEMVSEMVKEAGPVLTQREIEIIADVSQEVGAKVNEKQVKVIAMLSEAMGPTMSEEELETIAEVASVVEETARLASDSTLQVVAQMVKAKVGEKMSENQLEQIKEIMVVANDIAPARETFPALAVSNGNGETVRFLTTVPLCVDFFSSSSSL